MFSHVVPPKEGGACGHQTIKRREPRIGSRETGRTRRRAGRGRLQRVLLCDFDGTIVMVDTCEYLLDTFVADDWRAFNTLLERGAITLEDCTQRQLALLNLTEAEALTALGPITSFRPHFRELVDYCATHDIRFIVVSGGLDFVIHHFLQTAGLEQRVRVYAAASRVTQTGIDLTFPDRVDETARDFKEDLVKQHIRQGFQIFYVGDGLSDLNAARRAHVSFVIKGSKLAELCQREQLPHREITDFHEVITALDEAAAPPA